MTPNGAGGLLAFEQITSTCNYLPLWSYFFPVDTTALSFESGN